MQGIIADVIARTGLDASTAADVVRTVAEALASHLDAATRRELEAIVPLSSSEPRMPIALEELRFRIAHRSGISPGRAIEVASVCQVIADRLDRDTRARLHRQLPADLRALLEPPPSQEGEVPDIEHLPGTGGTLAAGRPGSAHPLSEAGPGSSHPVSEARPPSRRWR